MSATVFAGSAQFVAVDIWREPAPWLLLTVTALHDQPAPPADGRLAGAARSVISAQCTSLIALFTMVDETWALCEQRAARRS